MQKYTFKSHFATDFEYIAPKNNLPTILYLHGFCSDAWGRKPDEVKSVCEAKGLGFLRFDFAGHGSDIAHFAQADFAVWQSQVTEMIEDVIGGDCIMVGSSMGGWLSLKAAIDFPQRVKGVIGLAAAPNFVKRFAGQISDEQKKDLSAKGYFTITNNDFSYTITSRFVETAFAACLPEDGTKWPINCPVHLLQGMKDASVPWKAVLDYAELIASDKVLVKILKNSNHRLNDDEAIVEIRASVANIVNICQ